jgi:hypothetical protein
LKRQTIGVLTALAMLIVASSALAAIDTYTGGYGFHGAPGSMTAPAPLSFTQHFKIKSAQAGSLPGILTRVRTEISGATVNTAGFKRCTAARINRSARYDKVCAKGALVASGSVRAQLGTQASWTPSGLPCNSVLNVWNAGPHKLAFFLRTTPRAQCLGGAIQTGAAPAFTATYRQAGKNLLVNIPVPSGVTNPGRGPYFVAVSSEFLTWHSSTNGKGMHDITSIGCKGRRHFSYSFSARTPSGQDETKTITGTAVCG